MLRVVTLRPLPIADQLGLRPFPVLGIEERKHPDWDPVGLGAPRAALAIARPTIFDAALAIRPPDLPRLGAIVVGFPL